MLGLEEVVVGNSTWMRAGQQYLHLTESSGTPVAGTFYHFALTVDDIKSFTKNLLKKGILVFDLDKDLKEEPLSPENKNQQFFIKDPDGNLIELLDSKNNFFFP